MGCPKTWGNNGTHNIHTGRLYDFKETFVIHIHSINVMNNLKTSSWFCLGRNWPQLLKTHEALNET